MFDIRVIPDEGEPYRVTINTRQIMAWENVHRDNTLARLNTNPRLADHYFLAYLKAKSLGLFTGSLDEFKGSADLEVLTGEEDTSGPTRPGP